MNSNSLLIRRAHSPVNISICMAWASLILGVGLTTGSLASEARIMPPLKRKQFERTYRPALAPTVAATTVEIFSKPAAESIARDRIPDDTVILHYYRDRKACDPDESLGHPGNQIHYYCVVWSRQARGQPTSLGPADSIEYAMAQLLEESDSALKLIARSGEKQACQSFLDRSRTLSHLLIRPLWSCIRNYRKWMVLSDTPIVHLPFQVLPAPGVPEPSLLVDGYTISCATHFDLMFGKKEHPRPVGILDMVIFASPDFDASLQIAGPYMDPNTTRASSLSAPLSKPTTEHSRGSTWRWGPLPSASREGHTLAALAQREGITVRLYSGTQATRAQLLTVRHPRYLHLATHGFSDASVAPSRVSAEPCGRLAHLPSAPMPTFPSSASFDMTLLLNSNQSAGLVWAGANRSSSLGQSISTAWEFARLDLKGTDLVVLSACATGVGNKQGRVEPTEMPESLHRSGARSVLASVWNVPDAETCELMVLFYQELLNGFSKSTALTRAMRFMRKSRLKQYGAAHPYYWGGFILSGDPG